MSNFNLETGSIQCVSHCLKVSSISLEMDGIYIFIRHQVLQKDTREGGNIETKSESMWWFSIIGSLAS